MFVDTLRSQPFLSSGQVEILDRYHSLLITTDVPHDLTQPAAVYLSEVTDQCVAIADDEERVATAEQDISRINRRHEESRSLLALSSWGAACFYAKLTVTSQLLANYTGLAIAQHDFEAVEGERRRAPVMAHLQAQFCMSHVLDGASLLLKPWFAEEPSVLDMATIIDSVSDLSTPLILNRRQRELLSSSLMTPVIPDMGNMSSIAANVSSPLENADAGDPRELAHSSLTQLGERSLKLTDEEMQHGATLIRKIADFLLRATEVKTPLTAEMQQALVTHPLARNYIFLYDSLPFTHPDDHLAKFELRAQEIGRQASQI